VYAVAHLAAHFGLLFGRKESPRNGSWGFFAPTEPTWWEQQQEKYVREYIQAREGYIISIGYGYPAAGKQAQRRSNATSERPMQAHFKVVYVDWRGTRREVSYIIPDEQNQIRFNGTWSAPVPSRPLPKPAQPVAIAPSIQRILVIREPTEEEIIRDLNQMGKWLTVEVESLAE
jgi:hypothetical protein